MEEKAGTRVTLTLKELAKLLNVKKVESVYVSPYTCYYEPQKVDFYVEKKLGD